MPGARCTRGLVCQSAHRMAHTSIQVSGEHSDIPCAMALRLTSCSSRRRIPFCHRRLRIRGSVDPVGSTSPPQPWHQQRMPEPHDFAVRSSLRLSPTSHVLPAEVLTKALKHRSSCTPSIAHEVHLALRHLARAMLPRPPHPIPTYSDDGRRPSSGMRRGGYNSDLQKWKAKYFCVWGLTLILLIRIICPTDMFNLPGADHVDFLQVRARFRPCTHKFGDFAFGPIANGKRT